MQALLFQGPVVFAVYLLVFFPSYSGMCAAYVPNQSEKSKSKIESGVWCSRGRQINRIDICVCCKTRCGLFVIK